MYIVLSVVDTGGEECPMYLWWPVMSAEYEESFLSIAGFDHASSCIAGSLNLSRTNFVDSESNCPTDFLWKG